MKEIINSLIMTLTNLGSILLGFAIYYVSGSKNQIAVQVVSACILSILIFMFWHYLSYRFFRKSVIENKKSLVLVYFLSLVWTPIIFIPLHYITQGYLTSWDNINGVWMFQVPTNALLLLMYYRYNNLLHLQDLIKK